MPKDVVYSDVRAEPGAQIAYSAAMSKIKPPQCSIYRQVEFSLALLYRLT